MQFLFTLIHLFISRQNEKIVSLAGLFFVMLGIQSAFAQSYVVKGNVVSKLDNEPLIGVSVMQKGTANGAVTDMDGNYELKIQGGKLLWYSLILVCGRRNCLSIHGPEC